MTKDQDKTTTKNFAAEPYITVKTAAEYLGMPENSIYKLALSRRVPSYKVGKCRRFKLSELAALMESCRVEGAAE
jgi:excisionase family DNA binding protein